MTACHGVRLPPHAVARRGRVPRRRVLDLRPRRAARRRAAPARRPVGVRAGRAPPARRRTLAHQPDLPAVVAAARPRDDDGARSRPRSAAAGRARRAAGVRPTLGGGRLRVVRRGVRDARGGAAGPPRRAGLRPGGGLRRGAGLHRRAGDPGRRPSQRVGGGGRALPAARARRGRVSPAAPDPGRRRGRGGLAVAPRAADRARDPGLARGTAARSARASRRAARRGPARRVRAVRRAVVVAQRRRRRLAALQSLRLRRDRILGGAPRAHRAPGLRAAAAVVAARARRRAAGPVGEVAGVPPPCAQARAVRAGRRDRVADGPRASRPRSPHPPRGAPPRRRRRSRWSRWRR